MRVRSGLLANINGVSLALCLLHFGLACYALGARSLWGDEAYSVWASKQSLARLFGGIDTQPPFSYLLLALTSAAWGYSVFAVRFVSVCFGLLTVAVMGQVGQRYFGSASRLAVLAFMALSPILIYFDQEARMYTLACAQCAATMWIAARLVTGTPCRRRHRWGLLALMTVIAISALYTHFYTVAILGVNAVVLAWGVVRRRLSGAEWLLAHGLIAVGFGSWFVAVQLPVLGRNAGGSGPWLPTLAVAGRYLQEGVLGLMLGMRADSGLGWAALGLLLICLLGVSSLWRSRHLRLRGVFILGYFFAAMGIALATSTLVPAFNPRYFLFALLPLALAFGAWWTPRSSASTLSFGKRAVLSTLVGLAVLAAAGYGNRTVFDLSWDKSGYPAMLKTIRDQWQTHDGTLLMNSDQYGLYDYYGPIGPVDQDAATWLVNNNPRQATDAQFEQFVGGKQRVWVVNYGSASVQPSHFEQLLRQRGVRVLNQGYGDGALALYQLGPGASDSDIVTAEAVPFNIRFGTAIVLRQVRLHQPMVRPGAAVALDLVWQATGTPAADYTVFVHVRQLDPTVNRLQFANDSAPANGTAPTSGWRAGQLITDTHGVPIPADAPAGTYQVVVGLYQYPSFERLLIQAQDAGAGPTAKTATEIEIGRIVVQP